MRTEELELEFITPAFLCGANQSKAELRAPSIRGALRWWFRILGGTLDEEESVFGGVHDGAKKSRVQIRCCIKKACSKQQYEKTKIGSDLNYIYYFAEVSSDGSRIGREAYWAEGTTFCVTITGGGIPKESAAVLFWQAVDCFKHLGALGLRSTRGCGAFCDAKEVLTEQQFRDWSRNVPEECGIVRLVSEEVCSSAKKTQEILGSYLRGLRKDYHLNGKNEKTALGYSIKNERMSSALKLRPVKIKEGYLAVVFYSDKACNCSSLKETIENTTKCV